MKEFWERFQKNTNGQRESRRRLPKGAVALALFACLVFASYQATRAVVTSATYGDRELPIYCVDTTEKKVALSFDAAWGAEDFPRIMEVLEKHNVKVTFFMTGGWVDDNPDCVKDLVKRGHDLGNHSQHHYDMTTISKKEQEQEVMEVHNKVKELTGYEMFLFRPPYGAYDNSVITTVYGLKYYPIQWSVDSLDWKDYGVDSIINTVCNHKALEPGAIILCHNGAKYTADALDTMLTNLEEQGYTIVPISELIMRENYHMDVTGKQIAD
ncbi:MAG: polysaccharide deacetylase family protein [Muribaculaceae bacterium]|nr:polysaccharide deacetylase family protein [Roseburia sp.]MCM1431797.1 polysaccharide deacetylase family protein [Muribaculaceae bacterium]MCM1493478.1 polysaccharide deacetylase family protein [Muribaculaceae bacterium]